MNTKIVNDTKNYIKKNIDDNNVRRDVLIVFDNYISTLDNIYNCIKEDDELSADIYLKAAVGSFTKRLDIFLEGNGYPYYKVSYIIANKSLYDEEKLNNKHLSYLYNKIIFGDFSFEFYYEILMYPNKNYKTICCDLDNLMAHLGYNNHIKKYKDANINVKKYKSLCKAIENVE